MALLDDIDIDADVHTATPSGAIWGRGAFLGHALPPQDLIGHVLLGHVQLGNARLGDTILGHALVGHVLLGHALLTCRP